MCRGLGLTSGLIMLFVVSVVARAQSLIVYTEHYPPYNYLNDSGEITGLATERVRQVLDAAGLEYNIQLVPWARAMKSMAEEENALIYTITRTPKREASFDWLVPIAKPNFYLFVRANETRPVTREALEKGQFQGTCVSNDLTCEMLLWTGMPAENIIPISKQGTGDFRMVVAGRADIYISDLAVNDLLRKTAGFDASLTKPIKRLEVETGFYLASSKNMPAKIREKIRETHKKLAKEGRYSLVEFPHQ